MKRLNYKLAKKLKDAGFSQYFKDGWSEGGGEGYWAGLDEEYHRPDDQGCFWQDGLESETVVYIPTLEELIDACEAPISQFEHEVTLKKYRYGESEHRFDAYICCFGDRLLAKGCKTPKEAMAKLWLKLNEK